MSDIRIRLDGDARFTVQATMACRCFRSERSMARPREDPKPPFTSTAGCCRELIGRIPVLRLFRRDWLAYSLDGSREILLGRWMAARPLPSSLPLGLSTGPF